MKRQAVPREERLGERDMSAPRGPAPEDGAHRMLEQRLQQCRRHIRNVAVPGFT